MGKTDYIGYGERSNVEQWETKKGQSSRSIEDEKAPAASIAKTASRGSVEQIENVGEVATKPSKKRRLKRHCARWWCCYCIGNVIFLAIFLPLFFLYVIPAVAQLMVENADLPIHAVTIMQPAPDSVVLSLRASLKIPKPFKVRLEPFTLTLFRPETKPNIVPYVNFDFPETWVQGNTTIEIVNQKVAIADRDEFKEFLRAAVEGETFKLAARGETTAHMGALKAKVTLDKEVEMGGLRKLEGFRINSATLLLSPEEDGTTLLANVTIPNHSIVEFELGNQTLNLNGPNNIIIGNATIQNVSVRRGNNTFAARGFLDLKTTLQNFNSILAFTAPALAQGNLMLGASGNQTVYNGQHISYYEDILNNLHLTGEVSIIQLLVDSFTHLMSNGLNFRGIRELMEQLGINGTNILEILGGPLGERLLKEKGTVDLSRFLNV